MPAGALSVDIAAPRPKCSRLIPLACSRSARERVTLSLRLAALDQCPADVIGQRSLMLWICTV